MTKIFISHASEDNSHALALAQWLDREGWSGDYFLDLDRDAIAPGERWENALRAAARRCEAVVLLISKNWLASSWCYDEMRLGRHLGKQLIGVVIDQSVQIKDLPDVLTREWQICDLTVESDRTAFLVSPPPARKETEIELSAAGLERLKLGLERAGLSAEAFSWPPEEQPDRHPYRGLKPLEEVDAAVFFGRDAELLEAVSETRIMRDSVTESLLVIVGASGAGKSSFLRAGLLPRLRRDSQRFLVAPIIRPRRGVVNGADGLVASLDGLYRECEIGVSRATLRERLLASPDGLSGAIGELRAHVSGGAESTAGGPTVIIPVDQGEELFADTWTEDTTRFFQLVRGEANRDVELGEAASTPFILVVTIRSDSYNRLQEEDALGAIPRRLFDLAPVAPAHYQMIIEGPAARATQAGERLAIDPRLTRELLRDATGSDTLPLLAYTLEQLYVEHRGDGELRVEAYEKLGQIRGVLAVSVEAALAEPSREPAIPASKDEQLALLRKAFIPHLVDLSEDNQPVRRTTPWTKLPAPTRPVIERLIERRLLVRDRRIVEDETVDIVEIAHESLLRHWSEMEDWLAEERTRIRILADARRAAGRWKEGGRQVDDLVLRGLRLEEALKLRDDPDYGPQLSEEDTDEFLVACKENEARLKRLRNRAVSAVVVILAVSTIVLGWFWNVADQSLLSSGKAWIARARADLANDRPYAAYLESGMVLGRGPWDTGRRFVPAHTAEAVEAESLFAIASAIVPTTLSEYQHAGPVYSLDVSPDGSTLATGGAAEVTVRQLATGAIIARLSGHANQVHEVQFLGSANRLVTTDIDGRVAFWDLASRTGAIECPPPSDHDTYIYGLDYNAALGIIAVGDGSGALSLWNAESGRLLYRDYLSEQPIISVAFAPDGTHLYTGGQKNEIALWSVDLSVTPPLAELEKVKGHEGIVFSLAVNHDGTEVLSGATDKRVRVWTPRLVPLRELPRQVTELWDVRYHDGLESVVVTSRDNIIRLYDVRSGKQIHAIDQHEGWVYETGSVGSEILSVSDDGSAKRFNMSPALTSVRALPSNDDDVTSGAFSRDGKWFASGGRDGDELQTVNVWRVAGGAVSRHCAIGTAGTFWQLAFSPDSSVLAVASQGARGITMWRPESCEQVGEPLTMPDSDSGFEVLAFSPDGERLVAAPTGSGQSARIVIFDLATGRVVARGGAHEGNVKALAFHPTSKYLASGDAKGRLVLWQVGGGSVQPVQTLDEYAYVKTLAFSPDGTLLARGGDRGELLLYSVEQSAGRSIALGVAPERLVLHESMVNAVTFSADGTQLAVGADDHRLSVWDLRSRKVTHNLAALTGIWGPFGFHPTLPWLAFDGGNGVARVWDMSASPYNQGTRRRVAGDEHNESIGANSVINLKAEPQASCNSGQ